MSLYKVKLAKFHSSEDQWGCKVDSWYQVVDNGSRWYSVHLGEDFKTTIARKWFSDIMEVEISL